MGRGENHGFHGSRFAQELRQEALGTDPASPKSYGRTGWPSILILILIVILILIEWLGERD